MLESSGAVQWAGRKAAVTLPEHVDVSNAGQIREDLLSAIDRGATALIADMTATVSCDHAGADAVVRVYQLAAVHGAELRLVVTAPIVSRALSIAGVDRLVSIYPSLEAAMAASAPAALVTRAAGRGRPGVNGRLPPPRAGQATRPVQTPGAANGSKPEIIPDVLGELVDALPNGVALADDGGVLVLASRQLETIFGYDQAELLGHPVECLIPAGFQAAFRGHQAACAQAPAARPMAGARLAGRRKDGTTFPAEISLSPIATLAGHVTLVVIRDVTDAWRPEDLAQVAVAAGPGHAGQDMLDTVITSLFQVGLSLAAATDLPAEVTKQRIAEALGHLDDTIREIRYSAFSTRGPSAPRAP
jgi:anti-anti-sigma factor